MNALCSDPTCLCCHRENYDQNLNYIGPPPPQSWWQRWLAWWRG